MASLKSKLAVVVVCTAASVGCFFAGGWFYSRKTEDNVPVQMLRGSLPIALDMILTAKDLPAGDGMKCLAGDVEYRFTNVSTKPTKLAFPPVRTFFFSATRGEASWGMIDEPPKFALEQRVIDLAPGQVVTFTHEMFMSARSSYPDAGVGWRGFVFARPPEAKSDDGYCAGMMIPRFFVLHEGATRQNQAVHAERAEYIADLRTLNQAVEGIATVVEEAAAADPSEHD